MKHYFLAFIFLCGCANPPAETPIVQPKIAVHPTVVIKPPSSITNVWLIGDAVHVGSWRAVFPEGFNPTNYIWNLISSTNLTGTNWTQQDPNFDYQWEGSEMAFKIDHGIPGKFYRLYGETNSHP